MNNLSNEELISIYKSGDKKALDIIVENNQGIIHKIAKRYNIENQNAIEYDDLIQEGNIGLFIAAKKYDINNEIKAKFITYAGYWIQHKISRFVTTKHTNYESSLNTKISDDGESEKIDFLKDIVDCIERSIEDIDSIHLREELIELMENTLSLKQNDIIRMNYGFNDANYPMSLIEIAKIYNSESSGIRNIRERALSELRKTKYVRSMAKERFVDMDIENIICDPKNYVCKVESNKERYDKWFT